MKNTNILLTTLLFSSLLAGCGMKGPLYRTPVEQPPAETLQQTEQTPQSNPETNSEEQNSTPENTVISE